MTTILPLTLSGVGLQVNQRTLLRNVNHSFTGTSITVVLGHNGAGKTLMLKVCHGLVAPTAGQVRWNDPERARRPGVQGMVFQRPVLLRRSVRQNIEHVLRTCGVPKHEKSRRIDQALETGRLVDMADRPARRLSGGEQQRVALARAWAARPEVLILDEPCTFLDPGATREVERIIAAFYESGTKVIMATHDVAQARRLAGEIVLMHGGTIAESGPAEEFFARPKTEETRAFLEGRLWTAEAEHKLAN
ncbi:MAG: ATP-binding cassette domain-containing protein [Gammaproteobacteria bacterium]|nr:ATP-binding cassette domain-containing protein [Gammaproteobacteria bacterium]